MAEGGRWTRRDAVIVALLGLLPSGCSYTAQLPLPGNATTPLASRQSPRSATEKLFVANSYSVGIYDTKNGQYQGRIGNGRYDGRSVFVASNGNVLVVNYHASLITVYGGPGFKDLQKLRGLGVSPMAEDSSGNLYALGRKVVEVFAPGSSMPYDPTPIRTIKSGIQQASDVAVDGSGNVFVANFRPGTNVVMYAPGSSTPTQTITNGISYPYTLAIDSSNNLYVGNRGPTPTVTVYAAGTFALTHTITDNITGPSAMTFHDKTLYVANSGDGCCANVDAYTGKTLTLSRTIDSGVSEPDGLAVDANNNLYVANFGNNSVTVYGPRGDQPVRTITENVSYPTEIGLER